MNANIVITPDQFKQFLAEVPRAAILLGRDFAKARELGELIDGWIAQRGIVQDEPAKCEQRCAPDFGVLSAAQKEPCPTKGEAMFIRDFETTKSDWAWGLTAEQSALYVRSTRIGRDRAKRILVMHGCVRVGSDERPVSEEDLIRKFGQAGLSCSGRLQDYE